MKNSILTFVLVAIFTVLVASITLIYSDVFYITNNDNKRGYLIEKVDRAEKEVIEIDFLTFLEGADIQKGKRVAKKCMSCHNFVGQANKVGPNLKNVFNSKKGSIEGFKYSQAMLNKGGIWGVEELYYFIKKPKNYIKGTNMGFAGIKKDSHLKHLIAYIKSNSNK